jgi:hypothetical protein
VALLNDTTALIVFDNLNQIARVDLSFQRRKSNGLKPAPSPGIGFEDIAHDDKSGRMFCLIEALEDFDGQLRGFVVEYDSAGRFACCTRLDTKFEKENKGFEGLEHVWHGGREFLYALREGKHGKGQRHSGDRIDMFARTRDGGWEAVSSIRCRKRQILRTMRPLPIGSGRLP